MTDQPTPQTEARVWLIEAGQPEGKPLAIWWTGSTYTAVAADAMRFPTKVAALAYIGADRRLGRPVEHIFVGDQPTPQTEGLLRELDACTPRFEGGSPNPTNGGSTAFSGWYVPDWLMQRIRDAVKHQALDDCDEARRLLRYLWTATGRSGDDPVSSLFDADDPIVADVERLAAEADG